METVIFNADFEWQLFQSKQLIKSTRKTQEFEYLINWINPEFTIFTTKKYPKEYQRWFFKFLQEAFKYSASADRVIPWSGTYDQIELKRRLQDKSKTLKFASDYKLGPVDFSLLTSREQVESDFLYKFPKSLSGMGHYEFNDQKQISVLLNSGEILTKERKLQRTLDFSTLWKDENIICYYKNIINDSYQYRGTIIDREQHILNESQRGSFEEKLPLIQGWLDGLKGYFSIDSFIYNDGSGEQIYYLSEINCRKTMGYSAYQLKQKFFPSVRLVKFVFGNYKISVKDYGKLWEESEKSIIALSPDEGKFKAFLIAGSSPEELYEKEKLIS